MIDISQGVHLFNDSDFFSAHDYFEDIWMEAGQNEKFFWKNTMCRLSVRRQFKKQGAFFNG